VTVTEFLRAFRLQRWSLQAEVAHRSVRATHIFGTKLPP
jgi:hypothetical protein